MNVVELRDKLNDLIFDGKGDYKVIEHIEGVYEINNIIEGFIIKSNPNRKSFIFHSLDDLNDYTEEDRQELLDQIKTNVITLGI